MASAKTKRRPGFPLTAKVFLVAAVAALVVGGTAVVVFVANTGSADPRGPARNDLSSAYSALTAFQEQRFERLRLIARMLAEEPGVVRLAPAEDQSSSGPEVERVRAEALLLLSDRCKDLGCDLAAVVGTDGTLLVRTDSPEAVGEDLSGRPLIARSVKDGFASGVFAEDGHLYDAVSAPVVRDFNVVAHVLVGVSVDNLMGLEIRRIGRVEVLFLSGAGGELQTVSGTLAPGPAAALLAAVGRQVKDLPGLVRTGKLHDGEPVRIEGHLYLPRIAPLKNAVGDAVGAALLAAPLGQAAGEGGWLPLLAVAGAMGVALVLAVILSALVAHGADGPVRKLVAAVEKARAGDLARPDRLPRSGAAGRLADSLSAWFRDLRQQRALRQAAGSAFARGGGEGGGRGEAATATEATLLAIEMRRYAGAASDPEAALDRLGRDLRNVRSTVAAEGGRVEAFVGHRVLASFRGDARSRRAVAAAGRIHQLLGERENAFDEAEPPTLAVASGKVGSGSMPTPSGPEPVLVGLPVQQIEGLLREAAPGDLLLSRGVHRDVEADLAAAGAADREQRGILSPQAFYGLAAAAAAGLAAGRERGGGSFGPGDVVEDRFEILSTLGTGPAGTCYLARDRELGRTVVWKALDPATLANPGEVDRLESGLPAYRRFAHAYAAHTFDFGRADGVPYLVREHVQGLSFRDLFASAGGGRLDPDAAIAIGRELAAVLGAAHAEGLVHGRLKPENAFLELSGDLKVTDFGVVLVAGPGGDDGGSHRAPEQRAGSVGDARADVYAAGLLLSRLFTGRAVGEPEATSGSGTAPPPAVETILARCIAAEPAQRFADGRELLTALEGLG